MESSVSQTDINQSFRSPPRRRRSTFFERRDSIVPQTQPENVDPNSYKKSDVYEMRNEELLSYYNKLLSEKVQWKKEVTNRRSKYHDFRQQLTHESKAPSRSSMSYSALSKEDIEFLEGKPNISKLIVSQSELHKSVGQTRDIYRRLCELDSVILDQVEDRVNKITEYILENSTVEMTE